MKFNNLHDMEEFISNLSSGSGGIQIDDESTTSTIETWSAKKIATEISTIKNDTANLTSGMTNIRQYNVLGDDSIGDSDTIQAMINQKRQEILTFGFSKQNTVDVPSGKYIIDKEIKMSPYLKLKALGNVEFELQFNGTAFWISPSIGDPIYGNNDATKPIHLRKNVWTRGKYFDGSNGTFTFTTTLNNDSTGNNTIAIEIGDRDIASNQALPVSRYVIENANVYGLHAAIKHNSINNYIGTFKHCHWELNNHAIWVTSPTPGKQYNSGENFNYDNCIIAGCKKPAVYVDAAGHDQTFNHCSFDFNSSPLFYSTHSGVSTRLDHCYIEKVGDWFGVGEQLIYKAESTLDAESWGRNSFYINNLIVYLKRPTKLFTNLPNPSGGRIRLYLDIDGMETRYDNYDPYDIDNRFMVDDENENIRLISRKVINTNSIAKNHVSRSGNLVRNGDFEESMVGTYLTMANKEADGSWYCSYHDSVTGPIITQEGLKGSKCLRYNIVRPDNVLKVEYKGLIPVEPGEMLNLSALFLLDKVSARNEIKYRFSWYDAMGNWMYDFDYLEIFSESSDVTAQDGTKFRTSRSHALLFVPKYAAKVKPAVITGNIDADYILIDDIHFSKSK